MEKKLILPQVTFHQRRQVLITIKHEYLALRPLDGELLGLLTNWLYISCRLPLRIS